MKIAAARAIAAIIRPSDITEDYVIPSVFDRRVVEAVADGVAEAAGRTGVARRHRRRPVPTVTPEV
jgi:malate dehydrogenase (oxaloacetate-decarboxylating)